MKTIIKTLIEMLNKEIEILKTKLTSFPAEISDICSPNEISRGDKKLDLLYKIGEYLELNDVNSENNPFFHWSEYRNFIHCVPRANLPATTEMAAFYRTTVCLCNGDNSAINESINSRKKLVLFLQKLISMDLETLKGNKDIWLLCKQK